MKSVSTEFRRFLSLQMALVLLTTCSVAFAGAGHKKRLLVLTAIGGDPDDDEIFYRWFHYPQAGDNPYDGNIAIMNTNTVSAGFVMPEIHSNQEIHVILEVKDSGEPALYGYRRIVVR